MKNVKVLLVVLSSLFAIGYQFSFNSNPECFSSLSTGNERPTTFVFVIDLSISWKYLEKLLYLYKHISCGIPDSPELTLLVSHVWNNGGNVSKLFTSSKFSDMIVREVPAAKSEDHSCQQVERAFSQISKDILRKNVQFIVPIISQNCSIIEVFNQNFMNDPELHFNGILLGKNWSKPMKQQQHVVVEISNITIVNPKMKSMGSGEDIVRQIDEFLNKVMSTSATQPEKHVIVVKSVSDQDEYGINHHDNDTYASFRHVENRGDVFRDNFWGFLVLIALIVLLISILMITFCFCCLRKKKSRKVASPMTATRSTESKSHDRATFATNEPMLIPKRKLPIIIRPRKVLLVQDQVDEWNKPKEAVSPAAGSLSATQVPTLNEIRITERQNLELNQEMGVYPKIYKPKRPSTNFVIE